MNLENKMLARQHNNIIKSQQCCVESKGSHISFIKTSPTFCLNQQKGKSMICWFNHPAKNHIQGQDGMDNNKC